MSFQKPSGEDLFEGIPYGVRKLLERIYRRSCKLYGKHCVVVERDVFLVGLFSAYISIDDLFWEKYSDSSLLCSNKNITYVWYVPYDDCSYKRKTLAIYNMTDHMIFDNIPLDKASFNIIGKLNIGVVYSMSLYKEVWIDNYFRNKFHNHLSMTDDECLANYIYIVERDNLYSNIFGTTLNGISQIDDMIDIKLIEKRILYLIEHLVRSFGDAMTDVTCYVKNMDKNSKVFLSHKVYSNDIYGTAYKLCIRDSEYSDESDYSDDSGYLDGLEHFYDPGYPEDLRASRDLEHVGDMFPEKGVYLIIDMRDGSLCLCTPELIIRIYLIGDAFDYIYFDAHLPGSYYTPSKEEEEREAKLMEGIISCYGSRGYNICSNNVSLHMKMLLRGLSNVDHTFLID